MRKVVAIISVLLFLFLSGGTGYYFILEQQKIRSEIKASIKKGVSESDLFWFDMNEVASSPSFRWGKKNEFHYKGGMYDIVRFENGMAGCINDKQEEVLFALLGNLSHDGLGSKYHLRFHPFQLFYVEENDVQYHASVFIHPVKFTACETLIGINFLPDFPPEFFIC